jgi:hypothetical protein
MITSIAESISPCGRGKETSQAGISRNTFAAAPMRSSSGIDPDVDDRVLDRRTLART